MFRNKLLNKVIVEEKEEKEKKKPKNATDNTQ